MHSVASQSPRKEACYRCGRTNHKASNCKFKEAVCPNCGKRGNLKRRCKQPQRGDKRGNRWRKERKNQVGGHRTGPGEDPDGFYVIRKSSNRLVQVELQLDGNPVTMEGDTGATMSLILERRLPKVAHIITLWQCCRLTLQRGYQ